MKGPERGSWAGVPEPAPGELHGSPTCSQSRRLPAPLHRHTQAHKRTEGGEVTPSPLRGQSEGGLSRCLCAGMRSKVTLQHLRMLAPFVEPRGKHRGGSSIFRGL